MRILSQDGMIDVPYEQVVIQQFKEKIYFLNKNLTGVENLVDDLELASYSTEAKAKRAMEMLYKTYTGEIRGYKTEEGNWFCRRKTYECACFQFPADEELED